MCPPSSIVSWSAGPLHSPASVFSFSQEGEVGAAFFAGSSAAAARVKAAAKRRAAVRKLFINSSWRARITRPRRAVERRLPPSYDPLQEPRMKVKGTVLLSRAAFVRKHFGEEGWKKVL